MSYQRHILPLSLALAVELVTFPVRAECPPDCDLEGLRARALARAPEISGAEARLSMSEALYDEARFAALNLGHVELRAFPTPRRIGDFAHSQQTDISFSQEMSLYNTIRAEVMLALTPWWIIVEMWRAARGGIEMSNQELAIARGQALFTVDRAYREAQVASAIVVALRRAHRVVAQALGYVEHLLDEDMEGADETERLRLVVTLSQLEARRESAEGDRRIALARLRSASSLPPGSRIEVAPLDFGIDDIAPLEWHLETARRMRPEVRLTIAGVSAAGHLVRARQAELVPELAMGFFYGTRRASVVDDQTSPFISDPWNGWSFGYGLVYRWAPSPGERAARIHQARADLAFARAMRRHALGGIAYQVEEAYINASEDDIVLGARARALEIARDRFAAVVTLRRRGEAEPRDLPTAALEQVAQEVAHIRAAGRALVSRAQLELATGTLGGAGAR